MIFKKKLKLRYRIHIRTFYEIRLFYYQGIILSLSFLQEYFKDAESWKTFFYEVKRAGKYEGEFLIQPQMDSLANRLTALLKEYPRREKRLAFEEYQQKVQALRESAEAKLQVWTEKLGQQEDVELMLEDYNDFVNTQQLFHKYNSLSTDLSKKADVWKKSAGQ